MCGGVGGGGSEGLGEWGVSVRKKTTSIMEKFSGTMQQIIYNVIVQNHFLLSLDEISVINFKLYQCIHFTFPEYYSKHIGPVI